MASSVLPVYPHSSSLPDHFYYSAVGAADRTLRNANGLASNRTTGEECFKSLNGLTLWQARVSGLLHSKGD
eukprot:753915-Hanusia_phi.AAC.28